jgi:23S rRNA (cytosine1962-C5)-methyltransferase
MTFQASGWVKLIPQEDRRLRDGHLWIYKDQIGERSPEAEDGDVVGILDARGRRLGLGCLNSHSVIAVRLLARGAGAEFTRETFSQRLDLALRRRDHLRADARRLVNAEGDLLPGLLVDIYGDVVVVQLQTLFWEKRKGLVLEELDRALKSRAMVLRNDSSGRKREGLEQYTEIARGSLEGNVTIGQDDLALEVDVLAGQKTGFYIDQRENRRLALPWVEASSVLDCCCYTGAWSLACARAGAAQVLGLDCSEKAIGLALENARRNQLEDKAEFRVADVFEELPRLAAARRKFDVIILDPPALARSRRELSGAERGYVHLNRLALGLLKSGGILITCSCSHHVSAEMFRQMVARAAALSRRQAAVLRTAGQPEDHPWLVGLPETNYLKCLLVGIN